MLMGDGWVAGFGGFVHAFGGGNVWLVSRPGMVLSLSGRTIPGSPRFYLPPESLLPFPFLSLDLTFPVLLLSPFLSYIEIFFFLKIEPYISQLTESRPVRTQPRPYKPPQNV
jgi:hypothetical protein